MSKKKLKKAKLKKAAKTQKAGAKRSQGRPRLTTSETLAGFQVDGDDPSAAEGTDFRGFQITEHHLDRLDRFLERWNEAFPDQPLRGRSAALRAVLGSLKV